MWTRVVLGAMAVATSLEMGLLFGLKDVSATHNKEFAKIHNIWPNVATLSADVELLKSELNQFKKQVFLIVEQVLSSLSAKGNKNWSACKTIQPVINMRIVET